MQEFIEKLIARLEEEKSLVPYNKILDTIEDKPKEIGQLMTYQRVIEIVNQLAEEHKSDKVNQLAMIYAQNMYMYGVDVTKALETATSQSAALNEAYLRGLHDERKYQYTQMKNNGDWIPCSERLPKIPNSYLVTKMCENDGNPIYDVAHEIFWTRDEKWDCERDEDCEWKVIAWQNKLAPYQPKGE